MIRVPEVDEEYVRSLMMKSAAMAEQHAKAKQKHLEKVSRSSHLGKNASSQRLTFEVSGFLWFV